MPTAIRGGLVKALRSAAVFEIPLEILEACIAATPGLVDDPERLASLESAIKPALLRAEELPRETLFAALPVLGNIAEAVVECILVDHGWQPVHDDTAGASFGHGVDLLMLDPALERMFAIEVKSTVQQSRWPRLARGRKEQLTPTWYDASSNQAMVESGLSSADIYTMVAQVHFRRRLWRSCVAGDICKPQPVADEDQISDLGWLLPT
jgi:hypothetical protein